MIHCPNCNELLGEQAEYCPHCKKAFSEEFKEELLKKSIESNEARIKRAMDEHRRRLRLSFVFFAIGLFTVIAGSIVIICLGLDLTFLYILPVLWLLIYLFGIFKFRIGLCPYCEEPLGRNHFWIEHCPRCGKQLR